MKEFTFLRKRILELSVNSFVMSKRLISILLSQASSALEVDAALSTRESPFCKGLVGGGDRWKREQGISSFGGKRLGTKDTSSFINTEAE